VALIILFSPMIIATYLVNDIQDLPSHIVLLWRKIKVKG